MIFRFVNFVLLLVIILLTSYCKVSYDMSGASIPIDSKTVSIQYFANQAPIVQPTLSQDFTDALKDKFVSQTNLNVINGSGDLNFEGNITGYDVSVQDVTGDETASMNRLTIRVHVKYSCEQDGKYDYDTDFSRYADYDSNSDLDAVAASLHEEIIEQLVEDIFNKAVVNW